MNAYRLDQPGSWPAHFPADLVKVLNIVDEHPEWSHTVISLAKHGAVSVRTLELRFRQYLDTTPSRYVTEARLDRIRDLLVQGSPDTTTVEEVATGTWYSSFGHLIRHYVKRFGEQPMDTLSRIDGARDGARDGASDGGRDGIPDGAFDGGRDGIPDGVASDRRDGTGSGGSGLGERS